MRRTHLQKEPEEDIRSRINIWLPTPMKHFLEIEAKKQSEERGRHINMKDIIRALITAYWEKRLANLLVNPDD